MVPRNSGLCRHSITVNQFATLYSFVRNGAGLTVVLDLARPLANDRGLISRPLIRPRISRDMGIIRFRGCELTPAATGLLTLVKERLGRIYNKSGIIFSISFRLQNYLSDLIVAPESSRRKAYILISSHRRQARAISLGPCQHGQCCTLKTL